MKFFFPLLQAQGEYLMEMSGGSFTGGSFTGGAKGSGDMDYRLHGTYKALKEVGAEFLVPGLAKGNTQRVDSMPRLCSQIR